MNRKQEKDEYSHSDHEDKTIAVHNIKDLQGWPQETDGTLQISPAVGDLEGDGDLEIVVGDYTGTRDAKIYIWDSSGTPLDKWPKKNDYDIEMWHSPVLADLDDDEDLEIIFPDEWRINIWNHDGTNFANWPITWILSMPPVVQDIDQDGDLEIIAAVRVNIGGTYEKQVCAWHHDKTIVNYWPQTVDKFIWSTPAVGNIDEEVELEIVVGAQDGYVYAWHHDGETVEGWPIQTDEPPGSNDIITSPALGDIDGGGDIEIICGGNTHLYAWHHDATIVDGWPKSYGVTIMCSPALGDLDQNVEGLEIVIGASSGNRNVCAWHHDGSTVAGWPQQIDSGVWEMLSYTPSPALGDIDGDGDIEVVFIGATVDPQKVYAWHHNGTSVDGFPKQMASSLRATVSSPVLADLDRDGDVEIIVAASSGFVYVWDLDGAYNPENIEWGMFHHDMFHAGWYEFDSLLGGTISCGLICEPSIGTLPFTTQMSVTLTNSYCGQLRRIAGRIDVTLAGGSSFSNWRSGYTNVAPGGSYVTTWNQTIPAVGAVIGDNVFRLLAEDVTPSPYNQPPYPPSGDTDTDACTVTGIVP